MWWSTPSPRSFCGLIRESRRAECLLSACDFSFPLPYATDKQVNLWQCVVLQREQSAERGLFCETPGMELHQNGKDMLMLLCLQFSWKKLCCGNIKPERFLRGERHEVQISSPTDLPQKSGAVLSGVLNNFLLMPRSQFLNSLAGTICINYSFIECCLLALLNLDWLPSV